MFFTRLSTLALPTRRSQLVAAAVFVVCCALLGWSQVQAGCGDYVFVRDAQGRLVPAASRMHGHQHACPGGNCGQDQAGSLPSALAKQASTPLGGQQPAKRGCQGPFCNGGPQLPFVPFAPAPVPNSSARSFAALVGGPQDAGAASLAGETLRHSRQLLAVIHAPQDIFEPPRLS